MSSTKHQIVQLLRRSESGLGLRELSSILHVTPMAVHRQLKVLEGEGAILSELMRGKRGRPHFRYRLTPCAERFFPKTYARLVMDLLKEIRLSEGANRIRRIFQSRFREFFSSSSSTLNAEEICDVLNANGYTAESERINPRKHRINIYNCPTSEVAHEHPEICTSEQCVLAETMDAEVTRDHHILAGHHYCSYIVKKK